MKLQKMITMSLILLCVTTSLATQDADDFLSFLEARDESIKSYEIKLRQAYFDIELDKYEAFKKSVEQLAQAGSEDLNPSQQAEQLIKACVEKVRWLERNKLQRGDCFKEALGFSGGGTDIIVYDGRLYYDYSERNRQLDIYTRIPNVKHADLSDIGLKAGGLRTRRKVLSFEQSEEGVRFKRSLSDEDSIIITQEYDSNFILRHSQYRFGDRDYNDEYYIFHENIDGFPVPHLKIVIDVSSRRKECSVRIYVIEEVKLNCLLTDEDLSLGNIAESTLVIDYRFNPKIQWRYGEYCQAAANPDAVYDGRSTPEEMIRFLKDTSSDRAALSMRDSRLGRKAPRPHIQRWLSEPDDIETWPPSKFTVINFWSLGCGFCVREVPENNELAQWLKDQGGLFLSIHIAREEPEPVTDFMENHEVRYPVGLDESGGDRGYWNSATFAEYGVNSVPRYIVIAKDGRIISYDRSPTKEQLRQFMTKESDQVIANAKGKAGQRLDVMPKGWLADNLEPNSQVHGRFFVYRPETHDADLYELESPGDNTIDCQWTRHSADGQTVHEVMLTAKTPDWGQTLEGDIDLVARYGDFEEMVTIPYELRSRGLIQCVSPIIWFGPVKKGGTATRRITLQVDPLRKVSVSTVSVPSNLRVQILNEEQNPNNICIDCIFSSEKSGLQKGSIELLAVDGEGNKQSLELDYCAYVQP